MEFHIQTQIFLDGQSVMETFYSFCPQEILIQQLKQMTFCDPTL